MKFPLFDHDHYTDAEMELFELTTGRERYSTPIGPLTDYSATDLIVLTWIQARRTDPDVTLDDIRDRPVGA